MQIITKQQFKIAMAQKGLTNLKLAELLRVTPQEVCRIMNGEKFAKRQEDAFEEVLAYEEL